MFLSRNLELGQIWSADGDENYIRCNERGSPPAKVHFHPQPGDGGRLADHPRSGIALVLQVFPPFLLAGLGMVFAGLLLGRVTKQWDAFLHVREIMVLVPALLGLKGNLEMTLASRLSTHANMGHLDGGFRDIFAGGRFASILYGNLVAVQCQAIVVGLLASLVAISVNLMSNGSWNSSHALLLASSAVVAASVASLLLSVVMITVVIAARHFGLDPDNVASPIAGMLGDLCTLALLATIAEGLWSSRECCGFVQHALLLFYFWLGPLCSYAASCNEYGASVLKQGWTPVILSMFISSVGGIILKHSVHAFHMLASFAPVMNGAGGNLAAVHTSRLSTKMHHGGERLQKSPLDADDADSDVSSGPVLAFLAVPGALCFSSAIVGGLSGWKSGPTWLFLCVFVAAALFQVSFLILVATRLVPWLWQRGLDPDNAAIPYVTSVGDIVGTLALTAAFWILEELGGQPWTAAR
eukprot:TRINITY_DN42338_c0_g2_i1.p1 TRINITY_DN42338_c0_g2~~TRINITY_DN42338_c0_g2_i1.p1  ORF type:complete len:469 (-),score=46.63 TRINITY_DN42338_c0_g2_i1:324-1730(-)